MSDKTTRYSMEQTLQYLFRHCDTEQELDVIRWASDHLGGVYGDAGWAFAVRMEAEAFGKPVSEVIADARR
jgi:hypothetical protein